MKKILIAAIVVIGLSAAALAGNKREDTGFRSVDPGKFYGIVINAGANIIISQGEECSVKIEGDRRDTRKIQTVVENGALVINGPENNPSVVSITVSDLNLIEVNSNARVFVQGVLSSDILLLKVREKGSIRLDVRALKVGLIAKDSARIIISGSTGDLFARIYGNGTIQADGLDAFNRNEERVAMNPKREVKRSTLDLHQ